jgi:hypothetical protein
MTEERKFIIEQAALVEENFLAKKVSADPVCVEEFRTKPYYKDCVEAMAAAIAVIEHLL